ncbi:hypothetical protein GBAR_LOCUS31727 [Geodia barretti]|uniref:Fibronectin type-III domain-containing protein n=1 Tax=Geodia barretti TaxID=519541 RepID=A0AA35XI44_GEOBA|nr:hypothetical protein GBAR_LOCUS31727 [Geodia barretti]
MNYYSIVVLVFSTRCSPGDGGCFGCHTNRHNPQVESGRLQPHQRGCHRLQVEVQGGGEWGGEDPAVSGEATLEAVVTGLRPGGLYSLRVAAMNSAGEGTYAQSVRAATQTTTNSLETSTSPESSTSPETTWESCTEALVMTGCIGFIVGIVATLLVALPTFLLCCRRKLKMSSYGGSSDGGSIDDPVQEEEEKKTTNGDMVLSENSAYASTTVISPAANSYQDMAHSYQDLVIYEHVK